LSEATELKLHASREESLRCQANAESAQQRAALVEQVSFMLSSAHLGLMCVSCCHFKNLSQARALMSDELTSTQRRLVKCEQALAAPQLARAQQLERDLTSVQDQVCITSNETYLDSSVIHRVFGFSFALVRFCKRTKLVRSPNCTQPSSNVWLTTLSVL
jgi:hypothetical protein